MGITIIIEEHPDVRLTDEHVEATQKKQVEFTIEGIIKMSETLLSRFAGKALQPSQLELATDSPQTVEIDFEEAQLQLEAVDVGVGTPELGSVSSGLAEHSSGTDTLPFSNDDGTGETGEGTGETDDETGALAFTVEGVIRDVSEQVCESVAQGSTSVKSITFDVEESVQTDGGSENDPLFEFTLFGYGLTIRQDGTLIVDTGNGIDSVKPF